MRSNTGWASGGRGARAAVLCSVATALALTVLMPAARANFDELSWFDRSSSILQTGVSSIAVAPDDAQTIYVGGRGYVARSTDGGLSWQPVLLLTGSEAQLEEEGSLEVDAADLQRFDDSEAAIRFDEMRADVFDQLVELYGEEQAEAMLVELEEDLLDDAYGEMLDEVDAESFDPDYMARKERLEASGFSEEEASELAADPLAVWEIEVVADAPAHVYAATGRGLFRSIDRGQHWQRILSTATESGVGQGVLSVAVAQQGKLVLCGTVTGLQVSSDGGRTWDRSPGELSNAPVRRTIATLDANRFYALGMSRIYRSDDAGATWVPLSTAFDAGRLVDLVGLPDDADGLVASTGKTIYLSIDGGESWESLPTVGLDASGLGRVHVPVTATSSVFALGERDVFVLGPQAKEWQRVSSGLVGQDLYCVASFSDGSLWLGSSVGLLQGVVGEKAAVEAEVLQTLRTIWDAEPNPSQTIAAALAYNGYAELEPEGWVTQLYLSRLAPRVDLRFRFVTERRDHEEANYVLDPPTEPATVDNMDGHNYDTRIYGPNSPNLRWEVMAIWDLGGFLFDSTEVTIESILNQMRKARKRLALKVIKTYIKRRSLQVQVASGSRRKLETQITNQLKLEELTALLDGLSGGYFSSAYYAAALRAEGPLGTPGLVEAVAGFGQAALE